MDLDQINTYTALLFGFGTVRYHFLFSMYFHYVLFMLYNYV